MRCLCLQVRCFKYYHTVERLDCTGLPIFTCYQKKQTCTASTAASTFTAGNADNYRGWYDVQRCGTCNDYCYWDSTSASGVKHSMLSILLDVCMSQHWMWLPLQIALSSMFSKWTNLALLVATLSHSIRRTTTRTGDAAWRMAQLQMWYVRMTACLSLLRPFVGFQCARV